MIGTWNIKPCFVLVITLSIWFVQTGSTQATNCAHIEGQAVASPSTICKSFLYHIQTLYKHTSCLKTQFESTPF